MPDPTPPPEAAGGGDSATPPPASIDLTNPVIQAAIRTASEAAAANARSEAEKSIKALEAKRDEILAEKKRLQEAAEQATLDAKAREVAADPAKLNLLAEELATTKFEAHKRGYQEVEKAREAEIGTLKAEIETFKKKLRRETVLRELYSAAIPEDQKFIHDGAFDYLCSRLETLTEEKEIDGLPMPVLRFKVNNTWLPAGEQKTPDGLMGMREFLALARANKGPIQDLDFCFVSNGRGSGTTQNDSKDSAAGGDVDWNALSNEERTRLAAKNGQAWAERQIERALAKKRKQQAA